MTCAETRRQLPEPEPAVIAQVDDHLSLCPPCRGEQAALREVDRRIEQLGQHRLRHAAQVLDAVVIVEPDRLALDRAKGSLWRVAGVSVIAVAALFLTLLVFFHLR